MGDICIWVDVYIIWYTVMPLDNNCASINCIIYTYIGCEWIVYAYEESRVPLLRGPIYYDITNGIAMTATEHKSDLKNV